MPRQSGRRGIRLGRWALVLTVALGLAGSGTALAAAGPAPATHSSDITQVAGQVVIPVGTTLAGNIVTALGTVDVAGTVDGNVATQVGTILVAGRVGGDVTGNIGSVVITGEVDGNVDVSIGSLTLGPQSLVRGSVTVTTGSLSRATGARVLGTVSAPTPVAHGQLNWTGPHLVWRILAARALFGRAWPLPWAQPWQPHWLLRFLAYVAFLIVSVMVVSLFGPSTARLADALVNRPGVALLAGAAVIILAFPMAMMLLVSVLGIPLIPLWFILLVVGRFFGYVAVSLLLGRQLHWGGQPLGPQLAVAAGVTMQAIVGSVPLLGLLLSLTVSAMALGAVLVTRFGTRSA